MPDYRRPVVPGATVFLTVVTYRRRPLFADPANVALLRRALGQVRTEWPFEVTAAVVLSDHVHFLWTLPPHDADFSRRVGRVKALVTKAVDPILPTNDLCESRRKHREAGVWQRRFWDHVIRDEEDFERHMDYIHFNPVKHGVVACPHAWPWSSFRHWVAQGTYDLRWGCSCEDRPVNVSDFARSGAAAGE